MNTLSAISGGVIAVAVIAAVAVLTWHGSITGEAAVGIFGTIIGGAGVGVTSHVAVKTGAKAAGGNP
jgi:hypothetical protein